VKLSDLVTGAVAGVVAAFAWWLLTALLRQWRLRRDFAWLAGCYSSTRKLKEQPEPERVSIAVDGNLLLVRFEGLAEGAAVEGEIAMNEQLPRSGRGHYAHRFSDGTQGWGFWDVQTLKESQTILVHTTFAANTVPPTAEVSGFVWERSSAA
jgi:hypothetical protein